MTNKTTLKEKIEMTVKFDSAEDYIAHAHGNIIKNFIEVEIKPENFLRIKETLMRIGIATKAKSKDEKPTLHQTCVLLQKRGKFYICHFKEMFLLDGNLKSEINEKEFKRRNHIVTLLKSWGLIDSIKVDGNEVDFTADGTSENIGGLNLKIIKAGEKGNWNLKSNYDVGSKVKK